MIISLKLLLIKAGVTSEVPDPSVGLIGIVNWLCIRTGQRDEMHHELALMELRVPSMSDGMTAEGSMEHSAQAHAECDASCEPPTVSSCTNFVSSNGPSEHSVYTCPPTVISKDNTNASSLIYKASGAEHLPSRLSQTDVTAQRYPTKPPASKQEWLRRLQPGQTTNANFENAYQAELRIPDAPRSTPEGSSPSDQNRMKRKSVDNTPTTSSQAFHSRSSLGGITDTISSSSDGECEFQENKRKRFKKTELDPYHWENCNTEICNALPVDIDGLRVFEIECENQFMMKVTKDGRPWGKWITSSRRGFVGARRIARCKGSPMCKFESCPYREQYACQNRTQFETRNHMIFCFVCGTPAEKVSCPAVKVWEYGKKSTHVRVMHKGQHTCAIKKLKTSRENIRKEIADNPQLKPNKLINEKMVKLVTSESFTWNEVEEVAEQFVDMKQLHNAREELKRELNPQGENYEALAMFKEKCDGKDEFFVYRINNRALNKRPSYCFKSSKSMGHLALQMDKDGDGILRDEYAYVDAKHDRVRGFKTLTLWTYHPVLRKLLCLAIMEIEEENTENLSLFWNLMNEMLQEISYNKETIFNPKGFVADVHHANWKSIKHVYGEQVIQRVVSCEFHFKQSVQRQARRLGSKSDDFISHATSMLEALTPVDFLSAYNNTNDLLQSTSHMTGWLNWWYDRRTHIFRAFKPSNAPSSNLAEVGHAKLASAGRPHMSLIEASRLDVAAAIRQNVELRTFEDGQSKGGKGLNFRQRMANQYKTQMKQAKAFCQELDKDIIISDQPPIFVQKGGKHRPTSSPARKKKTTAQLPRQPQSHVTVSPGTAIQPFHVVRFSMIINLRRCYGCGKQFKDRYKKEPNDVILKHLCHRKYRAPDGSFKSTRDLKPAYFHLKLDCARRVQPRMELSDVILNMEVFQGLTEAHKKVLRKFGLDV